MSNFDINKATERLMKEFNLTLDDIHQAMSGTVYIEFTMSDDEELKELFRSMGANYIDSTYLNNLVEQYGNTTITVRISDHNSPQWTSDLYDDAHVDILNEADLVEFIEDVRA